MTVFILTLAILSTLALAAFCAGAETGFLSVSRERILHLAREGGHRATIVNRALGEMGRTLTALLIGNNLASVAYSSASAALAIRLCSGSTARMIWGFLAAFTVLYFSEFMPKLLCAARPLRRTLMLAGVYSWLNRALFPLTALAMALTNVFLPKKETKYALTSADIIRILEDRKDGVCLSDIESALIGRLIALKRRGRPVTTEALLAALRDDDTPAGGVKA